MSGSERPLDVLIVEDHLEAANSLSQLLTLLGHTVRIARTGPMGLGMCAAGAPDVVLLDIALPGMDGYEVAREIRELPGGRDVTICAVTGFCLTECDIARIHESAMDHYLVKPVALSSLQAIFDQITPAAR